MTTITLETITPREPVVPQRPTESREEIKLGLRDYSARSKLLRNNRRQLTARCPDQWIALGDNWKLVVGDSHDDVLVKLKECGAYSPHSVVLRLETNPPRRIPTVWRKRNG